MQLPQILDTIERLLVASEHPDIVQVERYGDGAGPWGPSVERSQVATITGVRVLHKSTATASLWGAVWPGETSLAVPAEMPPPSMRAARLAIFAVQLLDIARPDAFRSWQLVALPDLGAERGRSPSGVSLVCADGTKMLLRATATGATVGQEAEEEPFPDYRIPDGVRTCLLVDAATAAQ